MLSIRFLISTLLIILQHFLINGEKQLKIKQFPEFPIPADKYFIIELVPVEDSAKLSANPYSSLVIVISGGSKTEKAIYDYGIKDMIDQEVDESLMRIQNWQKFPNQSIIASISFTRLAHNNTLSIFDISGIDSSDRRQKLKDLKDPIHQTTIELLIPPKVDLYISSAGGSKGELMLNEYGKAVCRSYGGIPRQRPLWINLEEFSVKDPSYSEERNEREVKIIATVTDHQKELQCRAGNTVETVKIIVFHHPSQIRLDPDISSGTMENGSSVICEAVDGYPAPSISWHWVKGPVKSEKYFNITENGRRLYIKPDAPIGSKWRFNCSAMNTIPGSKAVYNRTVAFEVGRQPEGLFELNLMFQIIIVVAVASAIIIFCMIIVFILCIVRKSCTNQSAARNNRRNGGPTKGMSEKKAPEGEQITLLPPKASQNHLDNSNVGSGLPPPPPEYQLMIENEVKSGNPHEPPVYNDMYPEVMYAELNTSDLPMKEVKSHKVNNNDDQVIYSQIIGTISTPDCGQSRNYHDSENV